jgi:hypothetical protein
LGAFFFFLVNRFWYLLYIQHSSITWYYYHVILKKSTQVISIIWERFRLKHKFSWYKSSEYFVYNRGRFSRTCCSNCRKINTSYGYLIFLRTVVINLMFAKPQTRILLIVYGVIVISLMSAKLFIYSISVCIRIIVPVVIRCILKFKRTRKKQESGCVPNLKPSYGVILSLKSKSQKKY